MAAICSARALLVGEVLECLQRVVSMRGASKLQLVMNPSAFLSCFYGVTQSFKVDYCVHLQQHSGL